MPDRRMGEVGLAVVVPATAGAGRRAVEAELAGLGQGAAGQLQGAPVGWRSVDALPANASGKVLKRELRQQYAS